MAQFVINSKGQTLDDLHHLCSIDKARFDGFAIHVNYDVTGRAVEYQHVPFENCRIEEPDDNGIVAHIAVHVDWRGKTTRNGKKVDVEGNNIDYIDTFNPKPEVVRRQIVAAGGIQHYKGQIMYVSGAGYMTYPTPVYDSVISEALTDEGLANVMLRNVRNNFLAAGILTRLKSQYAPDPLTTPNSSTYKEDEFEAQLAQLQGDTNALKILSFTADSKEEIPTWTPFTVQNFDKAFTATDDSIKDKIYSIFQQEGWLCIRNGKVGFGGTLINEIKQEYSERTAKERINLTQAYVKMLAVCALPLPAVPSYDNLTIEPIA